MAKPKDDLCRFVIDIPKDLHRDLKIISTIQRKSMRDIVLSLIKGLVDALEDQNKQL